MGLKQMRSSYAEFITNISLVYLAKARAYEQCA